MSAPLSVLEAAFPEGVPDRPITGGDLAERGYDLLGGCYGCGASIAAYNAFPSRSGFWCCRGCIGDAGFTSHAQFSAWRAMQERYQVVSWHGEAGSLWYVVDSDAPEAEQPAVVQTLHRHEDAALRASELNAADGAE